MKTTVTTFILLLFVLTGCSTMSNRPSEQEGASQARENQPFFPRGVNDIQIPSELKLDRDSSMFINTASYVGGIMTYEGRVEIDSLADFFITTMQKNGWKMAGSIRYKNNLLAFVKPRKSCIISIFDQGISFKTKVSIYLTDDMEKTNQASETIQ